MTTSLPIVTYVTLHLGSDLGPCPALAYLAVALDRLPLAEATALAADLTADHCAGPASHSNSRHPV